MRDNPGLTPLRNIAGPQQNSACRMVSRGGGHVIARERGIWRIDGGRPEAGALRCNISHSCSGCSDIQASPALRSRRATDDVAGYSGLHAAAHVGDAEMVNRLAASGANLDARGRRGVHRRMSVPSRLTTRPCGRWPLPVPT